MAADVKNLEPNWIFNTKFPTSRVPAIVQYGIPTIFEFSRAKKTV